MGQSSASFPALARLDVDPWQEATSLAEMPRVAAEARLSALIDALRREPASAIPSTASAALVALLPKRKAPNVRASDSIVAATGSPQTQIPLAFGAFAILMLIAVAVSALFSPGPEMGASSPAPRAAATAASHKLGP